MLAVICGLGALGIYYQLINDIGERDTDSDLSELYLTYERL